MPSRHPLRQWIRQLSWGDIRSSLLATLLIVAALGCALASTVAAREGNPATAATLAGLSLVLAAAIALTVVPRLFRQARREWFSLSYRITREGWGYFGILLILGLAAVNTGNNLIYIIFSAALAVLLVSALLSYLNLTGLSASLVLPDVLYAQQVSVIIVNLRNIKRWFPSLSLSLESRFAGFQGSAPSESCQSRSYLLYLPGGTRSQQQLRICFPRRGRYEQDLSEIASRVPFGFVRRSRKLELARELIVFPEIEPPNEFYEILPLLTGSFESYVRGLGSDLYSIRDYCEGEDARHLDWKATAKTGKLMIREFTRQDERRCCFVFDSDYPDFEESLRARFEKAVRICANALRHFQEMGNETRLVTWEDATGFNTSREALFQMLRILAVTEPLSALNPNLSSLAGDPSFKILFTPSPRGSIPTPVWASSHVVFIQDL